MGFLKNAWYVAALSEEVSKEPLVRKILAQPILFYRTEDSTVVGLSDRCAHKFAPLHKGKIKGDCIECPYHGLRFDAKGKCVYNPHGDGKIPNSAHVRCYPLHERDGIIWIWMGEESLADNSTVLDLSGFFGNGRSLMVAGKIEMKAPVELVMDNLMDLSHAPFLHTSTLASEGDAEKLNFRMEQEGNTIWAYHEVPNTTPTPQFEAAYTGGDRCDLHANMRWDAPSSLQLDVGITDVGGDIENGPYLHFAHLLTPIDKTNTRYFYLVSRNFAEDNEAVSKQLEEGVVYAFTKEDEPMIEAVAEYMGGEDLFALKPVLLATDAAGVRVRRTLLEMLENESVDS